jgi:hypothetical protein
MFASLTEPKSVRSGVPSSAIKIFYRERGRERVKEGGETKRERRPLA